MWRMIVGVIDITIGNFEIHGGIHRLTGEGAAPSNPTSTQYALQLSHQDHFFEAATDAEAMSTGMEMLGTIIKERMENFDGDPTAFAVIPVDDEEDSE